MAASSRATVSARRTWAPGKLSFTACAFCTMKITSTIRAGTPAIRAVRMPLIRVRSTGRCGLAAPGGDRAEPLADGRGVPRPAGVRSARACVVSYARVLLAIAGDSGIRLRDIAATLGITERSACAIVTDLAGAGYVAKHKDGRRNRSQIQAHLPLPESGQPATHHRRAARPPHRPARNYSTQLTPPRPWPGPVPHGALMVTGR
jgi:hypothetical protein